MSDRQPIPYVPRRKVPMSGLPDVHSEWKGLEEILPDIIERFHVGRELALEFGVWYGFSTAALAECFREVVGVDTFTGDVNSGLRDDLYESARNVLPSHVLLWTGEYKDYLEVYGWTHTPWDLIHIDIDHSYATTLELGSWAVDHAPVTLFHDTEAFPDVKRAVSDIASVTGAAFYNYPECHGLGILHRKETR